MSDPYVELLRQYDRETAAAHEVIRRARSRLREGLNALDRSAPPVEGESSTWASGAHDDEPNGPEMAVEAQIDGSPASETDAGRNGLAASSTTSPAAPSAKRRKHAKETYLCTCGRPFTSKGWRDRHAAKHRKEAAGGKPVGRARGREVDAVLHGGGGRLGE